MNEKPCSVQQSKQLTDAAKPFLGLPLSATQPGISFHMKSKLYTETLRTSGGIKITDGNKKSGAAAWQRNCHKAKILL